MSILKALENKTWEDLAGALENPDLYNSRRFL